MSGHESLPISRVDEPTGLVFQRATCSCGWASQAWYVDSDYVTRSHQSHLAAVRDGSPWDWMIAPAGRAS